MTHVADVFIRSREASGVFLYSFYEFTPWESRCALFFHHQIRMLKISEENLTITYFSLK